MIDQWVLDKVLSVASLVDLIGGTVPLHREGSAWIGACPACGGVLRVQQSPGYYECTNSRWSPPRCRERGDATQWVQRRDPSLSFVQAVTKLAWFSGLAGLVSQPSPGD